MHCWQSMRKTSTGQIGQDTMVLPPPGVQHLQVWLAQRPLSGNAFSIFNDGKTIDVAQVPGARVRHGRQNCPD